MTIVKYKDFDVSKLSILKPEKIDGVHTSSIRYGDSISTFILQTPLLNIVSSSIIQFPLAKRGQLFTVLEEIREKIASLIYQNSKDFFNGKQFSENHISSALVPLVTMDDSSLITINNIIISDTAIVYDSFGDISTLSLPLNNAKIMLKIQTISFTGRTIHVKMNVEKLQVEYKISKKKFEKCYLNESESDEETVNEMVVVSPEEIINEVDELDNLGEIKIEENQDTNDFFEESN